MAMPWNRSINVTCVNTKKRQEHNMYAHKKDRHVPPNNIKCNLCGYETTSTVNMEEHNDGTENSKSWATIQNLVLSQNLWKVRLRSKKQKQYHYFCIVCTPNLPKESFLFNLLCSEVLVHPNMMAEHMEELDLTFTSTLRTQFLSKPYHHTSATC